jgi:hypothetical protein
MVDNRHTQSDGFTLLLADANSSQFESSRERGIELEKCTDDPGRLVKLTFDCYR